MLGAIIAVIFALITFMSAIFLAGESIDSRWARYEKGMLARGIQVVRTPEWERQTKQVVPGIIAIGVLFLLFAIFIGSVENSVNKRSSPEIHTHISINGKTLTLEDSEACGLNPPMTCPPQILQKYQN